MGGGLPENINSEMNTNNNALQTGNPAEKKPYPPTAREAVVPESTNGKIISPTNNL